MIERVPSARSEYFDRLLFVKVRSEAATAPAAKKAGTILPASLGMVVAPGALPMPGALARMHRTGLVRRLTPVGRAAVAKGKAVKSFAMPAAFIGTKSEERGARLTAGVSLVEMEHASDVRTAQDELANDPSVEFVSRVPIRYFLARAPRRRAKASLTAAKAAPASGSPWNLRKIRWREARALPHFKDADKVKVAVLDTGVDGKHPDLAGRVAAYHWQHPDTPSVSGPNDIVGHGTHVSGTIAAAINNGLGINGICRCKLSVWKIFSDETIYDEWSDIFTYVVEPVMYIRALADCLDEGVDVINLSIGGPGKPDAQELQLFNALMANGTTIVAAMGNEREDGSPTSYPAAIPGVVAVGATSIDDSVANFSNRGDHISVCAPGKAIWSTLPTYPGQDGFEAAHDGGGPPKEGKPLRRETDYDSWSGTSMATPHVTAAAALAIAKSGVHDSDKTKTLLEKKAARVPGMSGKPFHPDYGHGRLDLYALLR